MYPTHCPCPNLFLGFCRNVAIATCIPNWISFAIGLNVALNFIVFLVFFTFKILEEEVCFSISFYFLFSNLKIYIVDYICSYPCNFWGFGLYFSNLHINVYHVFDVDFEYL
jgi:hypothetical protein